MIQSLRLAPYPHYESAPQIAIRNGVLPADRQAFRDLCHNLRMHVAAGLAVAREDREPGPHWHVPEFRESKSRMMSTTPNAPDHRPEGSTESPLLGGSIAQPGSRKGTT